MPNRSTLLSFEIRNIREYEDSICSFSFLNSQKVYDDVDSDSSVARLCGNVYDSKIVALCGINASGKTTLLSMIRFMLSVYLSNKPLDSFQSLLQRLHGSQDIEISAIFVVGGAVYKIDSAISKDDRDSFSFRDETLYELKGKISRQAISDEAMYKLVQNRNTLPEDAKLFLDKGKSIASMVQDKNDNSLLSFYSADSESDLRRFLRIQPEIIRYLDRSISSIELNSSSMMYTVRRVGQDPIEVNYKELLEILSSGTKRGIGFFSDMLAVLRYGGYLLVDELEDNFNKTIVVNIMEFFTRKKTNPNDAHLIFTTHYQELIDILDRNDSISITTRTKDGKLAVRNLSQYLKRNDVKRSDILSSDYYDLGTALDYTSYVSLRKSIEEAVRKE